MALVNDIIDTFQDATEEVTEGAAETAVESIPTSLIAGLSNGGDMTSPARGAVEAAKTGVKTSLDVVTAIRKTAQLSLAFAAETSARFIDFSGIAPKEWDQELRGMVMDLGGALGDLQDTFHTINQRLQELDDAKRKYRALLAEGERIQQEREIFRRRSAALIQGYRTRDAGFRIFRNEKLERYKSLFDLAARYTFLAAKAYDYETGLLNTQKGAEFINRIVNSRALGIVRDGEPQFAGSNTGDPGLSSVLAEMHSDWSVLKGRLGFNNADEYATTVSLRSEKYRILPGADSDLNWRDILERGRKADLLDDADVRRYCMQVTRGGGLPVPGIVVEFGTVVADGLNLFGQPLASGDHAFSPASFATKIYSVGVVLDGYKGIDNPGANSSAVSGSGGTSPSDPSITFLDTTALSATPYVYLIPVGVDSMRSPPLGDVQTVRTWAVDDVTVPLPFNIGGSDFSTKKLYQAGDTLSEDLFAVRKHQPFRAVANASLLGSSLNPLQPSQYTNSRLIGRSVWNSKWKLVIPGHTLLSNPNEGLDRFIQSVKDIKIHFSTYSYSGN